MQIVKNRSLKGFNTFHIDVEAKYFVGVNTIDDINSIFTDKALKWGNPLILGGGSNVLFTKNYEGLVIKNDLVGKEIVKETDEHIWVKAASGELWHSLVIYAIENKLGGIENLSLIPGTVGAAPIQNIGAYGVELVDTFYELEAVEIETCKIKTFNKTDCKFGYRNSIFKNALKGKYFITNVTLQLSKKPQFNIEYGAIRHTLEKLGVTELSVKTISDAVISIRKSKLPDPEEIGNAGSFFKNPEMENSTYESLKKDFPFIPGYFTEENLIKVPAGWFIEQCGWKGKRVGNTGAHKDQALVLVNYGNATGEEIFKLAKEIQESVQSRFGVRIEPEVNIF